jgi:hypothetical protein
MKIMSKTTIEEMGAIVSQALLDNGIEAFLSGGAVVSIYTKNKYESFDLDFVTFGDRKKIKTIMESLGFNQDKSRLFIHPNSKYFVEFPGTSTMIGDSPIEEFAERKVGKNLLKILTPTDCIKDRLAAYNHWKDKQGLEQAVLVAESQPFKLKEIEKFCKSEGKIEAFIDFVERLKK